MYQHRSQSGRLIHDLYVPAMIAAREESIRIHIVLFMIRSSLISDGHIIASGLMFENQIDLIACDNLSLSHRYSSLYFSISLTYSSPYTDILLPFLTIYPMISGSSSFSFTATMPFRITSSPDSIPLPMEYP